MERAFSLERTGTEIEGLATVGRATIAALQMNRPALVRARAMWVKLGEHLPYYPSFIRLGGLQSRKKLKTQAGSMVKPRVPQPTVQCVDTYCELYKDLFKEVRAYEAFKYLHIGLISDIKRKSWI